MASRWSAYPSSNLTAGTFALPSGLRLRVARPPGAALLSAADALWGPLRRESDVDWLWAEMGSFASDALALVRLDDGAPVALACSHAQRVLRLHVPAYRLDSLEVGPPFRGGEVGVFALAMVAARALECGARQLVLASTREAHKLYRRAGGTQSLAKGWSAPHGLLPFEFSEGSLRRLAEAFHERRED